MCDWCKHKFWTWKNIYSLNSVRNNSLTAAARLLRRLIDENQATKKHILLLLPRSKMPQYSAVDISGLCVAKLAKEIISGAFSLIGIM